MAETAQATMFDLSAKAALYLTLTVGLVVGFGLGYLLGAN